jgi:hypothetical protein
MTAALRLVVAVALALTTMACGGPRPPERPAAQPAPGRPSTDVGELTVSTTLVYTRLGLFASPTRPAGFGFIRNYQTSTTVDTLVGAWNDAAQTLTADVTVTIRSENLVYVDDSAVTTGGETPIRAARGRLRELTCPESVSVERACYLLQILR